MMFGLSEVDCWQLFWAVVFMCAGTAGCVGDNTHLQSRYRWMCVAALILGGVTIKGILLKHGIE